MRQQAVKKGTFIAKAPSNHHELRRIIELAGRLVDRSSRPSGAGGRIVPENVIPFPGIR